MAKKNKKDDKKPSGWNSITAAFDKMYPNQTEPLHFAPMISWRLGGDDPLDGISVYEAKDFYHFVTYGFSELYEKESSNSEYSGYGFELTLKLKKTKGVDEEELKCMGGIFQALARFVFSDSEIFQPYEYIYTGQKNGMDIKSESNITGFITLPDEAGVIDTPFGKLEFVQLLGMTDKELMTIVDKKHTVRELIEKFDLTNQLTDYTRGDLA